tara:strand:- start:301 stop:966 length:666 start_codon:yes stop_codon:yes gene_type:complete
MCFTEKQSLSLTFIGFIVSYYVYNNNKFELWFPILYFTLMELFQYLGYIAIRTNNKKLNKILSYLIYIHISFQPLIMNVWFSNFISKKNMDYMLFIYKLCFIAGIFMLLRINTINKNSDLCESDVEVHCGKNTELKIGPLHIMYLFKLKAPNYLVPSMFIHFFLFFIPIILLDVNKIVYVFTVLGPILSWAIAKNKDEIGSIWCFITIPIFIISLLYSKYN